MSLDQAHPRQPAHLVLVSKDQQVEALFREGLARTGLQSSFISFGSAINALRHLEKLSSDQCPESCLAIFDSDVMDLDLRSFSNGLHSVCPRISMSLLAMVSEAELEQVDMAQVSDVLVKPLCAMEVSMRLRSLMRLQRLGRSRRSLERQLQLTRTEHRITTARLRYRTHHDELTGLFNRTYMKQRISEISSAGEFERTCAALLYIDIDRIKIVNTYEGYQAGDQLLNRIAMSIRSTASENDIVARISSDEFAILLRDTNESAATEIGEKLRKQLSEARFHDSAHVYPLTASIGIAMLSRDHDTSAREALTHAYQACYVAKSERGNTVHVYNEHDRALVSERRALHWVPMIRDALTQERFRLVFQPILNIHTGMIEQYEVLVRMLAEDGSLMPPAEFIAVAEQTGLIHDIDRWVIGESLQVLSVLPDELTLNVNLSGRAFNDSTLIPFFKRKLEQIKGDPHRITFEITETAAIGNMEQTQKMVQQLRDLGCHLALDDFGSGFNSFMHFKQFPVDSVKIDGSFITNLKTDQIDQKLVESMVSNAQRLGKKTVAECVEDMETLELLRELGLDCAQGYLIGRPDPAMPTLRRWPADNDPDIVGDEPGQRLVGHDA
jgi:diguanylate cyclase (GGDEF)-like protein